MGAVMRLIALLLLCGPISWNTGEVDPFAPANEVRKAKAAPVPRPFSQDRTTQATIVQTRSVLESSSPSARGKDTARRNTKRSSMPRTVATEAVAITTDALFVRPAGGIRGC